MNSKETEYIEIGICPKCNSDDFYGDICTHCGYINTNEKILLQNFH